MKRIILSGALILSLAANLMSQAHHDGQSFRNPYPGYEERGLGDFLQWAVVDKIKGERPAKPDSYHFPVLKNDLQQVRANEKDFSVTWVGHSSLLIQMDGLNMLTDPIWSERASPVQIAGPKRFVPPGVRFDDLPKIDIVLISHNHYDHLDRSTIMKLGNKPLYFIPLGLGEQLLKWGIHNYIELDWWDSNKFNTVEFVCLPAQHFSGRGVMDRNKTLWASWLIKGKKLSFYFGGDSGYFPGYAEIGKKFGPIDFAALPIGAYLPRWFMKPMHMNPAEAVQAMQDLHASCFIPIHYGTFDLADDPLDQPLTDLKRAIGDSELEEERFWLLIHGETRWLHKKLEHQGEDTEVDK